MKIKYIAILPLLCLASCNKFLDVTPKGIVIPTTVPQYDGMLNSPTLTQAFSAEILNMDDDNYAYTQTSSTNTTVSAYLWREYINADSQTSPAVWGNLYNCIYFTNVIINGVMNATGGTVTQQQQLLGEALFERAYCYMDLLTVFAKAYNGPTASSDPGLPLVTTIDVGDKTPARSSVQATLDMMTSDLLRAVSYLPASNINKYRVTKYAAYALLSRIYLYKADYTNAKTYAELTLTATHSYLNYNNYPLTSSSATTLPKASVSPEVIFQRTSSNYTIPGQMLYSDDLISYFGATAYATNPDLRFRYFSVTYNNGTGRSTADGNYNNFGITFPEMDLTRAEVFARTGDASSAMTIVNSLRKNRIATASYANLTASDAATALNIVLAERRRELAFGGLRWFDMKRLDQDGRMASVKRINAAVAATSTTAAIPAILIDELLPKSLRYTFQIPARVLQFNPDMVKNAR